MAELNIDLQLASDKRKAEAMVLLSIYKNPDLYFEMNSLTEKDFDSVWKTHYQIVESVIKSGRTIINELEVGLVLDANVVLKEQYIHIGGWKTVHDGMKMVSEENWAAYLDALVRINCLAQLREHGFLPDNKYFEYAKSSLQEIQADTEGRMTEIFMRNESNDVVVELKDELDETIKEAHEGKNMGLPFSSAMLTKFTNGMSMGSVSIFSAISGAGKSFTSLIQILPSIWEHGEKLLIIANEEEVKKWRMDIITWVANNKLGGEFEKSRWNEGKFSNDEMKLLNEAAVWLKGKIADETIKFVNMESFKMAKTIKLIKSHIIRNDCKYFIIDTLKPDFDLSGNSAEISFKMLQSATKLYDLVKPSSLNAYVFCTYQISNSAGNKRFLTNSDMGLSKQIVNIAGLTILARKALQSEKTGGKSPIKVKNREGFMIELDPDKEYMIFFFGKNRKGPVHWQLVYEIDQGKMRMAELGLTRIEEGEF